MFGSDLEMRGYAVALCLALSVFFFIRYPSGVAILGFTVVGLGPFPLIGSLHYATVVLALQTALAVLLVGRLMLKGVGPDFFRRFRNCGNLYTYCILLIWVEILAVSFLDMNEYRSFALKFCVYSLWLPLLLLVLALPIQGADSWCRGVFLGLAGYATAFLAPLLPVMYLDARLQNALLGAGRLTTYLQDPINGSRMFFIGALGFFALGVCSKGRALTKWLLFGAAGFFFILMMLNGTRQFLLALAVALFLYFWRVMVTNRIELTFAALFVLAGFYSVEHYLLSAAGIERFDTAMLQEEVAVGRGAIWYEAMKAGMANPMTGVGFRNFGDEGVGLNEETGEVGAVKDCAHGFFQDVTAEHGMIPAIVTLVALIILMKQVFGGVGRAQTAEFGFLLVAVALAVVDNFSCSAYNAFGYHSLILLPMIFQRRRALATDQSSRPVLAIPRASDWRLPQAPSAVGTGPRSAEIGAGSLERDSSGRFLF